MSSPILRNFPDSFESERLLIRAPRFGDGPQVNQAILESFTELNHWMPWATKRPTVEETEENNRQATLDFLARKDLRLLCFLKDSQRFVVSSGLHRINWEIPSFEIGYWCRTPDSGKGLVTEAAKAIMNFGFAVLGAQRIEVRADEKNERSWRVAERLGLKLEGTFRSDARDSTGALRNTRIYARIRPEFEQLPS